MFYYTGVCDFETAKQAHRLAKIFTVICERKNIKNRKLMVGLMMSYKTVNGIPSKYSSVWLGNDDVKKVFIKHPSVFNTIHYADYNGDTTLPDLLSAEYFGGENLHAMQLDMIWPNINMIKEFQIERSWIKIVLQLNAPSLELANNDPAIVVQRLAKYGDSIHYVLLDKSHGKGVPLKADELLPFARAIKQDLPHIGIGFAGALGPYTMDSIIPILKEFPDANFDMQSQLRPNGNVMDQIHWPLAEKAVFENLRLISENQ